MRELPYLPVVWGVIIVITIIYALIVRSSEVYPTAWQLWRVILISLGITFVLGAVLLLLLRVDYILVLMITTITTFVIGHFGSRDYERPEPLPDFADDADMSSEDELEQSETDRV